MDSTPTYRMILQAVLTDYHTRTKDADSTLERQLILDPVHDHYMLMAVGWQGPRRIAHCLIHCDLKDGQVWIQTDSTEPGIAEQLVEQGIPKSAIVLAFLAPYKRPYSGFGVEHAA
ncbi:XisI protein [Herpetosiphon gulosus]|uniref:XisI protein n=1 Tax=Herpetosiphon gulosus TaxID=1973496 RepID=A0ABP9XAG2_9CHLR